MKSIIAIIIIGSILTSSCSTRRVNCKGLKAHPDYNQKYK